MFDAESFASYARARHTLYPSKGKAGKGLDFSALEALYLVHFFMF